MSSTFVYIQHLQTVSDIHVTVHGANGHNMHFMTTPDFDEKSSNFNEPYTCANTMYFECTCMTSPCPSASVSRSLSPRLCASSERKIFVGSAFRATVCTFVFGNWFFAFSNTQWIRPKLHVQWVFSCHCASHVAPVKSSKLHNLQSKIT